MAYQCGNAANVAPPGDYMLFVVDSKGVPSVARMIHMSNTATALSSDHVAGSVLGETVTFTATVTASSTPTGTVTFKDGSTTLGSGTLQSNGLATFSTSSLAVGTHSISATYGSDSSFSGSTSPTFSQVVDRGDTSVMLESNVNPAAFGQSLIFTALVSRDGTPTGTVSFLR